MTRCRSRLSSPDGLQPLRFGLLRAMGEWGGRPGADEAGETDAHIAGDISKKALKEYASERSLSRAREYGVHSLSLLFRGRLYIPSWSLNSHLELPYKLGTVPLGCLHGRFDTRPWPLPFSCGAKRKSASAPAVSPLPSPETLWTATSTSPGSLKTLP